MRAWLTTIARRITREETFQSLVAPALADLHFEANAGRPLARHYSRLPLVIAIALLRDIRIDIRLTIRAHAAWRRTAMWYAGLATVYWMPWYFEPGPLFDGGNPAPVRTLLVLVLFIPLRFVVIAATFHLRRDITVTSRTVPIATVGFAFLAVALMFLNPTMSPSAASPRDLFSARVVVGTVAMTCMYALYLSSYAMFGVILARGRGWTVPLRGLGLIVTYMLIQIVATAAAGPNSLLAADALREVGSSFLTAIAWLLGGHVFRANSPRQPVTVS